MKIRFVILGLSLLVISVASFRLVQKSYSQSESPSIEAPVSQVITLILPDQEYVLSQQDLAVLGTELVIPSKEYLVPTFHYDSDSGILITTSSPKDYVINVSELTKIIANYVDAENTKIKPTYTIRDHVEKNIAAYNSLLNQIYQLPLNIIVKDGSTKSELALDRAVLRDIIVPTLVELNVPPEVDRQKLLGYINSLLSPKQKKYFSPEVAYQSTRRAVHARFLGEATPQVLGVDDGPSSRGELADKYLEVDLSQQKMYFFIGHSLYKEYVVSTGAEYPTPVGEFHIINKDPKAFSGIYNVWMPYWMGFKYANDVGAYLGIHEIAYAVDAKGKPVYRYGNYIGDMMTGGCVALAPKDSREVYNLSDVGMLVRIVK